MLLDRQDTYKGSPWQPWTQNLYTYVGNNPVNWIDPSGHVPTVGGGEGEADESQARIAYKRQLHEEAERKAAEAPKCGSYDGKTVCSPVPGYLAGVGWDDGVVWRDHPIKKDPNDPTKPLHYLHRGVDFGVPRGTPVYAAMSGTVLAVVNTCDKEGEAYYKCGGTGINQGYGNYVIIRLDDNTTMILGHMDTDIKVAKDDRVVAGQQIGQAASTGTSDGPHVHWEWRGKDYISVIDPLARFPGLWFKKGSW